MTTLKTITFNGGKESITKLFEWKGDVFLKWEVSLIIERDIEIEFIWYLISLVIKEANYEIPQ